MKIKYFSSVSLLLLALLSSPLAAVARPSASPLPRVASTGAVATRAMLYYVNAVSGSDLTGDGSQANPWQTITYALDQVSGPDAEIHIAPGLYNTSLGENFPIAMEPGVSLIGSGYENTTIAGIASSNVISFSESIPYTESTKLSGLKIMSGTHGVYLNGASGTGMSPTIEWNWITANEVGIRSLASPDLEVHVMIKHNRISDNTTYGIQETAKADRVRINSTIEANEIVSNGWAGVRCTAHGDDGSHCLQQVIGNFIAYNGSNGINCRAATSGSCSSKIANNTILSNGQWGVHREQGTYYYGSSHLELFNNVIADNTDGGVLLITYPGAQDTATIVNNTIAYNNDVGIQGGLPTIANSIIWGHADDLDADVSQVSYSDVGEAGYAGTNHNISADPLFVDAVSGDYHLLSTSPALEAGDNSHSDLPETDIDGQPRIIGPNVDMGADEVPGALIITKDPAVSIVAAGAPLSYTICLTNTGHLTLTATITDTLPEQVSPPGLLTWTPAPIPPSQTWSTTFTVTVDQEYTGTLMNNVQVTTEEEAAGEAVCSVEVEEAIAGLIASNDGPTLLGQTTTLWATIQAGSHVSYTWSLGDGIQFYGPLITHAYPSLGMYTAVVTASNPVGQAVETTTVMVVQRYYLPIIMAPWP